MPAKPATFTTAALNQALANLATGEASMAIEDKFEELYPVSYDPNTNVLIVANDN